MTFIDVDGCLFRLNSAQTTTKCKLIRYTMMSTNVTKRKEKKRMKEYTHVEKKQNIMAYAMHAFFDLAQTALYLLFRDSSIFVRYLSVSRVPEFHIFTVPLKSHT